MRRPNDRKIRLVARFAEKVSQINERVRFVFGGGFDERAKIRPAAARVFRSGEFVGSVAPINFDRAVQFRVADQQNQIPLIELAERGDFG